MKYKNQYTKSPSRQYLPIESKKDSQDQQHEGYTMIPSYGLSTEEQDRETHKDQQCDNLLNNLQLNEAQRTAITSKSDTLQMPVTTTSE